MKLVARIHELANQSVDPRYRNQWDAAFTVYLWLLSAQCPAFADIAAEAVSKAQQCFWCTKLARYRLLDGTVRSGSVERISKAGGLSDTESGIPYGASESNTMMNFCGIAAAAATGRVTPVKGSVGRGLARAPSANSVTHYTGEKSLWLSLQSTGTGPVLDEAA